MADLRKREALLVEREAAIEKNRAEVENQQASVSRLLQQARSESARPRNIAPEMPVQRPRPTASSTHPRSGTRHEFSKNNKAGASTRMFLTAMPVSSNHPYPHVFVFRLYTGTRLFRQR